MAAAAPQMNRYGWLLAGAVTALVLLAGRLLPGAADAIEAPFRNLVISGIASDRPVWAVFLEAIAAVGVVAFAGFCLPRIGRKSAVFATLALGLGLLLLELALLLWLGTWVQLLLPILALLAGLAAALAAAQVDQPLPRVVPVPRKFTNVSSDNLPLMARNLQRQGQLDLAFETFQRCKMTTDVLDSLHGLGLEFERQKQPAKAQAVFHYLAGHDSRFRNLADRPPADCGRLM